MQADKKLLPNLLIIGAAKAGTTSLHNYLDQHPQIFMAKRKEPRFFLLWENPEKIALHIKEGRNEINKYSTLEAYQSLFADSENYPIKGESSTAYLANPECADKIKKLIPDVKIIALLRNPVERAFSNYVIYKNWRMEKMSFDKAVDEEIKTGRHSYQQPMQYLHMGKYVDSLKKYFSLFPGNQVRIYLHDEFNKNTKNVIRDIFEYLGVDSAFVPDLQTKYNNSYIRRYGQFPKFDNFLSRIQGSFRKFNSPSMEEIVRKHRFYRPAFEEVTRKKLIDYYATEISELEMLLDRDLSAWKK